MSQHEAVLAEMTVDMKYVKEEISDISDSLKNITDRQDSYDKKLWDINSNINKITTTVHEIQNHQQQDTAFNFLTTKIKPLLYTAFITASLTVVLFEIIERMILTK